jgi:hypothetical protein
MSTVDESEQLEKFEQYLFEMDDVLEDFTGESQALGYEMDYSLESLDGLERLLIEKDAGDQSQLKNRAARYLGEVFRRNVGGKWELCLKDPKYLYYGLPVLTAYSSTGIEFCPIELIENFMFKREPGMLQRVVRGDLEHADM